MKASVVMAVSAPILVAARGGPGGGRGRGFGCGGDDDDCVYDGCASSCFSSFWATATPTPTAFCDGNSDMHSCIESACTSDSEKYSSYSSKRSSVCSAYSSCDSTGTYTYSFTTPPGDYFGGRFSDRPIPTGEVVYTGCPWNGDGWGFPFWGGLGYGPGFWDGDEPGWKYATVTTTLSDTSATSTAVLEQAVSGDTTTFRTLGAEEANETGSGSGAAPTGVAGVKIVGAALGAVVAVAGMM